MEPITVTVQHAIELSGLGRSTLYRLIAEGKLETVRVGSRRLVKTKSLHSILAGEDEVR